MAWLQAVMHEMASAGSEAVLMCEEEPLVASVLDAARAAGIHLRVRGSGQAAAAPGGDVRALRPMYCICHFGLHALPLRRHESRMCCAVPCCAVPCGSRGALDSNSTSCAT